MPGLNNFPAQMPQGGLAKKKSKRPQVSNAALPPAPKGVAKKAKAKKGM